MVLWYCEKQRILIFHLAIEWRLTMKNGLNWLWTKLLVGIGWVIVALLAAGGWHGLVALAGGLDDLGALGATLFLWWPLFPVSIMCTLIIDNITRRVAKRPYDYCRPGWFTISWSAFYLLPIMLNWASKLAYLLGLAGVGKALFAYRWIAQPALILITVSAVVVAGGLATLFTYLRKYHLHSFAS
jgi:hypothetical protein